MDAVKKDPYGRDPRGTAKKAGVFKRKQVLETKLILDQNQNFLFFDDVRFKNEMNETSFSIDSFRRTI